MNLRNLFRDQSGATLVEFAMLLPVIFGSLLGVVQVGVGMQSYNSLRSVTAEASRYALVEYQKENEVSTTDIKNKAKSIATKAPYLLSASNLTVDVTRPEAQRVDGAIEYKIKVGYKVPTVLPFFGIDDIPITFSRPMFLLDTGT